MPPNHSQSKVICSEQSIVSRDDTTVLHVYKWASKDGSGQDKPTAEILLVHGYLEHAKRYEEFAHHLCSSSADIHVTAFDVRGHGKSKTYKKRLASTVAETDDCTEFPRGYVRHWEDYFDDVDTVRATLQPGIPHILFGHSNGGLIALTYWLKNAAESFPFDALMLSSPYLRPAKPIAAYKVWAANLIGSMSPYLASILTAPSDLKASDVTSCPTKQKEHELDQVLFGNASISWAYLVQQQQAKVTKALNGDGGDGDDDDHDGNGGAVVPRNSTKIWFGYGAKDVVASPTTNGQFAKHLREKSADKSFVTIVERPNDGHEIINEVGREEVYKMVEEWVVAISASARTVSKK